VVVEQTTLRPEARLEDPGSAPPPPDRRESGEPPPTATPRRPVTPVRPRRPARWTEPDVVDAPASYAIYRPDSAQEPEPAPAQRRVRSEAR